MFPCSVTTTSAAYICLIPCKCSLSSQQPTQALRYRPSVKRLGSCQAQRPYFTGANQSKTRRRAVKTPATSVTDLPLIQSEEDFTEALTQNKVIIVDWMARWCRKCIYLKPKIQKMMEEEFPGIPIVYVDVNAVPGSLVYGNGIKKMPTIALYQNKEKIAEHIAAEGGRDAVAKIKSMIESNLSTPELAEKTAA